MTKFQYKTQEHIPEEKQVGEVRYLTYPILEETSMVHHGFSTRVGGVSRGIYSTMNLSFAQGDEEEKVFENYRRMTQAVGVQNRYLVKAAQTHTTNVHKVTEQNKEDVLQDVDGLITDCDKVCLVTTYADCVPLFFVDVRNRAIGLSHSGWRGTVGKIGQKTLFRMKEEYGTNPEDVLVAIGPSICRDCYEVSEDVINEFRSSFDDIYWKEMFYQKANGKYQLDLWKTNEILLKEAGILPEHIAVTNICTCCNSELLFSHRATKGQRGAMAAFLALKKEE